MIITGAYASCASVTIRKSFEVCDITTHAVRETGAKVFIYVSFSQFPPFTYGSQHTTFISSNDTVPYNVHSAIYGTNTTTTATVTTIGEIGDTVLAGLIH